MKVLDFGLAKRTIGSVHSEDSPTMNTALTQAGVVLGTAAYMSPEQACGKPVDRRADVWAFGVVLYEMVTGKRLFRGESTTEVLASVLKEEPKLEHVPSQLRHLLRRCLEKDPQQRLRHIGDALEFVASEAPRETAAHSRSRTRIWIYGLAALILSAAVGTWARWPESPELQVAQFDIQSTPQVSLATGVVPTNTLDGQRFLYALPEAPDPQAPIIVMLNWQQNLKKK